MRLFIILLISITASSCSGGRIGYFIPFWPPEGAAVQSGEIVSVVSQSDIRDLYVIENNEDRKREEIARPMGRFFRKKKEAEAFMEKYIQYKNMFGYSEKSLILRTSPDDTPGREYRLRPSQIIKIIDKLPGPVNLGNLTGFWYQVLTEDGFEGYCFDTYLTVFEKDSRMTRTEAEKGFIDGFFANTWYPTSYLETLKSGRIVIDRLRTGEGLFPDAEAKKIVIQTQEQRIEYQFDNVISSGRDSIILSGTNVEINFYPDDKIFIKYAFKGVDYSGFYTLLDQPVDHYIGIEIQRRRDVIDYFLSRGRYLTSDLYGSITLQDKGRFTWTSYINLVPEIIPFGYGNSGTIRNDYFLSDSLSGSFDGVFSFVFDRNGKEIVFAYHFTDNGTQFTHIPEQGIENGIINIIPEEPHMYYFRQNMLLDSE